MRLLRSTRTRMVRLTVTAVLCAVAAIACVADGGETRRLTFNGRRLTAADAQTVGRLETQYGKRVPDGDYWYDDRSGAVGHFGGPTVAFIGAGLGLGGALPANASGGGDGRLSGVFVNGRELHPVDVAALRSLVGTVYPGRFWVDGVGNAGYEGGPALLNLFVVARQRADAAGRPSSTYRSDGRGNNAFVSPGCTAVNGHLGSSSDSATTSYYLGCD